MRRHGTRGVTLIDTIVGTALMLVVFLGIAAAFQLSIDAVTNNKARAGAVALAGERMDYIRSLAYESIGTAGGIPSGSIAQSETITFNGVEYTRRTLVLYGDDPADGSGVSDANANPADYKIAKVELSWYGRTGARTVSLVSRISPVGIESAVPGGTLEIIVVNAAAEPVSNAQVAVVNAALGINTAVFTNASGTVTYIGAPAGSSYQITVTKAGYSSAQTYSATAENTDPNPGNLTVSNGQTTSATFAIDLVSNINFTTYAHQSNTWSDSFGDESKIGAGTTNIEVSGQRARFAGSQPWTEPAQLFSETITPTALERWGTFSWNHTLPSETTITYHVYYPDGAGRTLVPDSVLPGNSVGFTGTEVSIESVPAGQYPSLILEAYLVALNPSAPSPSIEDWQVTYESGAPISVAFSMNGAKTIGSGPDGIIYKYDEAHTSDAAGNLSLTGLEWDAYSTSVDAGSSYDISSSCLPQPIVLAPNTTLNVQLFFQAKTANSLLVDVKHSSGATLSGASVRLTKGGSYDETVIADACGQAFFPGLTNGSYEITVTNPGNTTFNDTGVNVTDASRYSVVLE